MGTSKLYEVALKIEGNDRGVTITTVAAISNEEAQKKAKSHVGKRNDKIIPDDQIKILAVEEVGEHGCLSNHISKGLLKQIVANYQ